MTERRVIELVEYQPRHLPSVALESELAEALWHTYSDQVTVETPSFKTDRQWILVSRGWVGYIPLSETMGLALRPRVLLKNVFGMLEYAYQLGSFRFLEGLIECDSLEEFYDRLAHILARRVLDRVRRGLYRSYTPRHEALGYVTGRVDLGSHCRRPWEVGLPCDYEDHTADIEDNQILAWTLHRVAHSGACTERVLPAVRQAYRALQGAATLQSFGPNVCAGRLYNRLNNDYEMSHALCRFFLEHTGPALGTGSHQILPFLVNMARLFERFVAEWLRAHLPEGVELQDQEDVPIGELWGLSFTIDMVLYDRNTGRPVAVLDTKYKPEDRPAAEDLEQIVAYAQAKGCREAILVYPIALPVQFNEPVGDIRVRSLGFVLDGDLEDRGHRFLAALLEVVGYRLTS
jgi:5-methylcytosine-specific restriction enzyme subunit McrC